MKYWVLGQELGAVEKFWQGNGEKWSKIKWLEMRKVGGGGGGGGWSLCATPPPPPPRVLKDGGAGAMAPTVPNFLSHA